MHRKCCIHIESISHYTDQDYPSFETLSVTLPLIIILVVSLITVLVVAIIVQKVKSSTNTPNRTVVEKNRQVTENVPVEEDPYEALDWDKLPESEEKK